jgi:uncharacterized damage-inducible protein DinB
MSLTGVQEMKLLLFEELELIVRTTTRLLAKIQPEHQEFRPHPDMRTLKELAEHLTAIPAMDLLILQEYPEIEIRKLEAQYAEVPFSELSAKMAEGLAELRNYMNELPEEDFLHKQTTPFYIDHGATQAKWLVEIVTHAQHHRGQLFTYLKIQGYEVNMFDLY